MNTSIEKKKANTIVKWIKRLGLAILILVVLLGVLYGIAFLTTDYSLWSRLIVWKSASFYDYQRFPQRQISNSSYSYRFLPAQKTIPSYLATVTYDSNGQKVTKSLNRTYAVAN